MSFLKVIVGIISVIIISALIYIIGTYASKQAFLHYYKWHDKSYDWLASYQDMKVKDKYKIVFILSEPNVLSERETDNRILAACKNLGWEVYPLDSIAGNEDKIKAINPDFIFTNKWSLELGLKEKFSNYKVYALLSRPTANYFGDFLSFYPQFNDEKYLEIKFFDGFVISAPQPSLFKNYIEGLGKKFYGFKGYASVQYQKFVEVEPNQLVYMGMNWDNRRKSGKFNKIFAELSQRDDVFFYGSKEALEPIVGDSFVDIDNKAKVSAIDLIRKYGVNLMIHSKQHMNSGTPSGRGFETAAASVVGITDRHPFLMEVFGDSFLYIDIDASADRVVSQIEGHLAWIKQNPDKAKAKARKAYDIFINNYTLESLLLNVARMHEKILIDKPNS